MTLFLNPGVFLTVSVDHFRIKAQFPLEEMQMNTKLNN